MVREITFGILQSDSLNKFFCSITRSTVTTGDPFLESWFQLVSRKFPSENSKDAAASIVDNLCLVEKHYSSFIISYSYKYIAQENQLVLL